MKINLKKKSHVKGYALRGMALRKQVRFLLLLPVSVIVCTLNECVLVKHGVLIYLIIPASPQKCCPSIVFSMNFGKTLRFCAFVS